MTTVTEGTTFLTSTTGRPINEGELFAVIPEPAAYTKRTLGKWKITKAENARAYLEAIGVNSIIAGIVSGINADIELIRTADGIKQISTVNGSFISKTVVQQFKYGKKVAFKNPLTGNTELMSIDQSGEVLKLIFEHQDWLLC